MKFSALPSALAVGLCACHAGAQQAPLHDEFFWLGEMNRRAP